MTFRSAWRKYFHYYSNKYSRQSPVTEKKSGCKGGEGWDLCYIGSLLKIMWTNILSISIWYIDNQSCRLNMGCLIVSYHSLIASIFYNIIICINNLLYDLSTNYLWSKVIWNNSLCNQVISIWNSRLLKYFSKYMNSTKTAFSAPILPYFRRLRKYPCRLFDIIDSCLLLFNLFNEIIVPLISEFNKSK